MVIFKSTFWVYMNDSSRLHCVESLQNFIKLHDLNIPMSGKVDDVRIIPICI